MSKVGDCMIGIAEDVERITNGKISYEDAYNYICALDVMNITANDVANTLIFRRMEDK